MDWRTIRKRISHVLDLNGNSNKILMISEVKLIFEEMGRPELTEQDEVFLLM